MGDGELIDLEEKVWDLPPSMEKDLLIANMEMDKILLAQEMEELEAAIGYKREMNSPFS